MNGSNRRPPSKVPREGSAEALRSRLRAPSAAHASAVDRGKSRWTELEKAHLEQWWGLRDEEALARDLGRSPASVRKMARELFRRTRRAGPWTAGEVQRLKRHLGATTPHVIARILGRSVAEVERQILELGRIREGRPWSRRELGDFKRLYGTRTEEDLARIFGRPIDWITAEAQRLRLAKDKAYMAKIAGSGASRMPRWSPAEIEQLRELYPRLSNLEIAVQLGRSVKSIVSKAHHMELKKDKQRLQQMGRENVSLRYQQDDE